MTADDVRARFEAVWAKSRGMNLLRYDNGYYVDDDTGDAWEVWQAAHADLYGEVRELKMVIEGLSQYSHNAQEVRELVEAVVTHWMDDRGLVITSEFRNDPKSSSDYRAAYCIPCVKKGRKIVPVPAKFTHQEK